jgi:hypothetical protein
MIITIKNDEGVTTNFDINLISDEQKKQEATVIVQKIGNLQVTIEALDFSFISGLNLWILTIINSLF